MYYMVLMAVLAAAYLGHYMAHGYDWLELVSLMVALVVIITLAIKDRRDHK